MQFLNISYLLSVYKHFFANYTNIKILIEFLRVINTAKIFPK